MTHTLHRQGSSESLNEDYVMLVMRATGYNDEESIPRIREFLRIAVRNHALRIGSATIGGTVDKVEEINKNAKITGQAVFDNQEAVTAMLKDLKEADLGISVVVSGIFKKVDECLAMAGLKHHTANISLGIWGRTDKLPSDDILEVTTMCGHSMISPYLVKEMVRQIKEGTKKPEEAADQLAPRCTCGIFNTTRAAKLLEVMAQS